MGKRKNEDASFWIQMREAERNIIVFVFEHYKSIRQAAQVLGVSSNFLSVRIRKLKIVIPGLRVMSPKSRKKKKLKVKPKRAPRTREVPPAAVEATPPPASPPALRLVAPEEHEEPEDEDENENEDENDSEDEDDDADEEDEDEDEGAVDDETVETTN